VTADCLLEGTAARGEMPHEELEPELLNRIAMYIDATDTCVEELHSRVRPAAFAELSKHVWSHIPCLKRRLAVLEARASAKTEDGD
jgi:inhibitor of KinA sporulation pathway (predicted exonuclease)